MELSECPRALLHHLPSREYSTFTLLSARLWSVGFVGVELVGVGLLSTELLSAGLLNVG